MWNEYKEFITKTLQLEAVKTSNNGSRLESTLYSGPNILKSRETIITDGPTSIYNNIVYPKTGENLPCLGMDLMCFFEKKVVIVFDFQHPTPNYDFNHPIISYLLGDMHDNTDSNIRFFEPGNHFSRFIYVRKCSASEIHIISMYSNVMLESYDELFKFCQYLQKLIRVCIKSLISTC